MTTTQNPTISEDGTYTYTGTAPRPNTNQKSAFIHLIFIKCASISDFNRCNNLQTIIIKGEDVSISPNAFNSCTSLEALTINCTSVSISSNAFKSCENLQAIVFNCSNAILSGYGVFKDDNIRTIIFNCGSAEITANVFTDSTLNSITFNYGNYTLNGFGKAKLQSLVFNCDIINISNHLFDKSPLLETVSINATTVTLDYYAFFKCQNLKTFTIKCENALFGHSVFSGCINLTSVYIDASNLSIGRYGFSGCINLTSVYIDASNLSIGSNGFSGCASLININIAAVDASQVMGKQFTECKNLQSIYIKCQSSFGHHFAIFENCNISESVVIECKSLEDTIFSNCEINALDIYCSGLQQNVDKILTSSKVITIFKLTGNLAEIDNQKFSVNNFFNIIIVNNTDTENSLVIKQDSNTDWKAYEFTDDRPNRAMYSMNANSYYIYSKKLILKVKAFAEIKGLRTVHIECEHLNAGADEEKSGHIFDNNFYLNNLTIIAKDIILGRSIIFDTSITEFNLECENLSFYNIEKFFNIADYTVFTYCYVLEKVTLKCKNLNQSYMHFGAHCPKLKTINITMDKIIDPLGFRLYFTEIESLESIYVNYDKPIALYAEAFKNCANLSYLKLPNDVTLSEYAFYGCSSLPKFTISNCNKKIPDFAFYKCTNLTSIDIPEGTTTICEGAFLDSGLTTLTIPNTVREIKECAFENCCITNLTIPDTIQNIESHAFKNTAIKSLTIPAKFGTKINQSEHDYIFESCKDLRTIYIMGNVNSLPEGAFNSIPKQITIYFYGNKDIGEPNPFPDVAEKVCVTSKYKKSTYATVNIDPSCSIQYKIQSNEETLLVEYHNEFIKIILSLISLIL